MPEYLITWEININADNPKEAAEEALHSIVEGTAKIFKVFNVEDFSESLVDLENPLEDAPETD